MSDGTDAAQRLSADPAAGTDAAVPTETAVVAPAPAPPRREIWANLGHPFAIGLSLTIGALAAVALGVAFLNLSTIVIYIVMAMFAALALDPVVRLLERRGLSRAWGIVIAYAVFAILLVLVLWFVVPALFTQLGTLVANIPALISNFEQTDFYAWAQGAFGDQIGTILNHVEAFFLNPANLAAIGGGVVHLGIGIASAISGGVIIIVLSLYFLAGLPAIKDALVTLVPARSRPTMRSMTDEITGSIGGYLTGMVILAFCNSMIALALHLILQLPLPGLMAIAAFCITLIPLIGSVVYWIFATVIALFTDPTAALIFAIVYLIYMQLEAYVLTPRVMSKAVSVPGALVVIGALVGGTLMGLLGALVAIPITASILLIIKRIYVPRQDAKL
ncbi:AI-2E family transporter [Microbacterium sp. P5_E9]